VKFNKINQLKIKIINKILKALIKQKNLIIRNLIAVKNPYFSQIFSKASKVNFKKKK